MESSQIPGAESSSLLPAYGQALPKYGFLTHPWLLCKQELLSPSSENKQEMMGGRVSLPRALSIGG